MSNRFLTTIPMIIDTIGESAAYFKMHPLFAQAFDFLLNSDFSNETPGKVSLIEDKLTATLMDVQGKTSEEAKLEAHKQYIDIQLVVSGCETMGWSPLAVCSHELVAYNSEKDIVFYADEPSAHIKVQPGEFVVFFPTDAHAPCMSEGPIRKVVVKILV